MYAADFLTERLDVHRKAVQVAERLLNESQSGKTSPERREYLLGLAHYQLQEYPIAEEHLRASFLISQDPETAARLAVCHWRMGNLTEAETHIKLAISMNPNGRIETLMAETKPLYLSIFAQIQLASGHIDEARASAQAALQLDPADVAALYVLASAELIEGEPAKAVASLDQALAKAPTAFLGQKLKRERDTATALAAANVRLKPFTAELTAVQRLII